MQAQSPNMPPALSLAADRPLKHIRSRAAGETRTKRSEVKLVSSVNHRERKAVGCVAVSTTSANLALQSNIALGGNN